MQDLQINNGQVVKVGGIEPVDLVKVMRLRMSDRTVAHSVGAKCMQQ